jgi:hypothetical protein
VRLDHLLSKEPLGTPVWSDARADDRKTPGRCTGYSAGELARTVRKYVLSTQRGGKWNAIGTGGGVRRAHCSALGVRASEHLENSIASASIYSQVTKGLRWMPWRQEPMKDASGCEKLRGAAEKALIRRCPNGETRPGSCPVTQV